MKIKLKQLRPNPFRDVKRYPIQRAKVEALKASIRSTGFWDNVLTRAARQDARPTFEIAYGHHRLQALLELVKESVIDDEFELDLPVRNLDDSAMLRIMATENLAEWGGSAEVSDETVRVTRDFICRETKTPANEITAADIAQFLGGGWYEDRVAVSLSRLGLYDRGVMKPEDVAGMSFSQARKVQREAAKVEKATVREKLEAADDDELADVEQRKKIRNEARDRAKHVVEILIDQLRSGAPSSKVEEISLDAQAEAVNAEAAKDPDAAKTINTIDAAARAVNAREFQRKVEMLFKYRAYMSNDAKHELLGTLKEVGGWCRQIIEQIKDE